MERSSSSKTMEISSLSDAMERSSSHENSSNGETSDAMERSSSHDNSSIASSSDEMEDDLSPDDFPTGQISHDQIRKIAEITSYNFYILLKDTIKSLVINHKFFCFFYFFLFTSKNVIWFLLQKM
jgi:hypothetical protein